MILMLLKKQQYETGLVYSNLDIFILGNIGVYNNVTTITDSNAEVQTFHAFFAYICQDDIVKSWRTFFFLNMLHIIVCSY